MRLILFTFSFFSLSLCYASFPISNSQNSYELETVEAYQNPSEKNVSATLSLIGGILWLPALVLTIVGALAGAVVLTAAMTVLTIISVLIAIIFGIIGLTKKRRWVLALIGLLSGLLSILLLLGV
jgi:hypothetical protein